MAKKKAKKRAMRSIRSGRKTAAQIIKNQEILNNL